MKLNVLITAGPTREHIDPVRYISNASSGKMGYALAESARRRGHKVVLVSGPVSLKNPSGVKTIRIKTAGEMFAQVKKYFSWCDVMIGAAAVADYRPVATFKQKLKKSARNMLLRLAPTEDIIKTFASEKGRRIVAGFALESDNLFASAKKKLKTKKLDLIAANYPESIGSDKGTVWIINAAGDIEAIKNKSKNYIAGRILDEITEIYKRNSAR